MVVEVIRDGLGIVCSFRENFVKIFGDEGWGFFLFIIIVGGKEIFEVVGCIGYY